MVKHVTLWRDTEIYNPDGCVGTVKYVTLFQMICSRIVTYVTLYQMVVLGW